MGYPQPEVFVAAEAVVKGKPDPEGYLLAESHLNQHHNITTPRIVVFEDAPAGIKAGKSAGAVVIAVCTSHQRDQLVDSNPDYIVDDLTHITFEYRDNTLHFTLV